MTNGDNMMDMFDGGVTDAIAVASAPSASSCQPCLLDLDDIFGGGAAVDPPAAATHNRSMLTEAKPEPAAGQIDVNLLSDIFSAPPVVTATGRRRVRNIFAQTALAAARPLPLAPIYSPSQHWRKCHQPWLQ